MAKPNPLPTLLALLVLLPLALAGCGRPSDPAPEPSTPTASTDQLLGRRWVMEGAIPGRGSIKAGFELREDGTLAGHTGVNRANGSYALKAGTGIHIPPLTTTRMAGPPEAMDREQAFLGALAQATAWRIVDGKLELLAGDEVVLTLVEETGT